MRLKRQKLRDKKAREERLFSRYMEYFLPNRFSRMGINPDMPIKTFREYVAWKMAKAVEQRLKKSMIRFIDVGHELYRSVWQAPATTVTSSWATHVQSNHRAMGYQWRAFTPEGQERYTTNEDGYIQRVLPEQQNRAIRTLKDNSELMKQLREQTEKEVWPATDSPYGRFIKLFRADGAQSKRVDEPKWLSPEQNTYTQLYSTIEMPALKATVFFDLYEVRNGPLYVGRLSPEIKTTGEWTHDERP